MRAVDPAAAAEVEELADLQRDGLDRLVEMVRAWRGDLFLQFPPGTGPGADRRRPASPRRLGRGAQDGPVDDRLAGYIAAIAEYPRLSRDEELDLAQSIRGDARRLLVESDLRLVVSIARRYQGQGLSLADIIKEGNIGLLRAAEHFDPTHGYRSGTLATSWIRRAIDEAIARHRP